jgi:predicted MFS family arabinose efflux permease
MKNTSTSQYRLAVVIFFFINGFLYANCTGRLPELKGFFGVSNSTLGTMLFMTAIGALVAMPLTGWLTTRYSSGKLTVWTGLLFCCAVPLIPLSGNIQLGRVFFFLTGFFSGAMDITMNGQAVLVERAYKKTIMSSFHAAYSIGMALGAGSGALFATYHLALLPHLLSVGGLSLIILAIVSPIITRNQSPRQQPQASKHTQRRIPTFIWLIAIIAFCGMTGEGSIVDWSAIYVNTVVGTTKAFSALAVGAFAIAMTIGRLFGDRIIDRLGKRTVLLTSCAAAITGLSLVLIIVSPVTALLGFFLVGAGLSNVVPVIYSTAGNIQGIEPAAGIAIASTVGYTGFFVGPPSIGYLSDSFGLRIGLCFTLLLFTLMLTFISISLAASRPHPQNEAL